MESITLFIKRAVLYKDDFGTVAESVFGRRA